MVAFFLGRSDGSTESALAVAGVSTTAPVSTDFDSSADTDVADNDNPMLSAPAASSESAPIAEAEEASVAVDARPAPEVVDSPLVGVVPVTEPIPTPTTEPVATQNWLQLPAPQPGELPIPDLLPLDAYAETPPVVIGTLEIPRLGVIEELQQGMTLTAINRGPSHWPGTAAPGRQGNVVIAGHRTTHGAVFNGLDQLVAGDDVVFTTLDGAFTYAVREIEIVTPDALHIADQSEHAEATLFACHPKGSAAQRIVVRMDLTSAPIDAPFGADPLAGALSN